MTEYIERAALLGSICHETCGIAFCGATNCAFTAKVCSAPAADVAPVVHGRIVGSLEDGRYRRRFSCCGEDATMMTQWVWPKYCPNCGAKMDGGADHEAD